MGQSEDLRTLALSLVDADSGRLLRALSLHGPTPVHALAPLLDLAPAAVADLLAEARALGVVSCDSLDCYRVDSVMLEGVVRSNRARLLGEGA